MSDNPGVLIAIALAAAGALGVIATLAFQHVKRNKRVSDVAALPTDENALQLEKLQLEVRELLTSPNRVRATHTLSLVTAFLTATTTLAIALGGWAISILLQSDSDRQRESDAYSAFLANLGSNNAAVRVGAVVGLSSHLNAKDERLEQTTAVLLARLAADNNETVLQEIVRRFVAAGSIIVQPALDVQRQDLARFGDSLYRYEQALLIDGCARRLPAYNYANQAAHFSLDTALDGVLPDWSYRSSDRFGDANELLDSDMERMRAMIETDIGTSCSSILEWSSTAPRELLSANPSPARGYFDQLVGISSIISGIISDDPDVLRDAKLDGSVILGLRSNSDLHEYHLSRSYLAGDGSKTRFDGANLEGADLYHVYTDRTTSFANAALKYAIFSADAFYYGGLPNFNGASWWEAVVVTTDDATKSRDIAPYSCEKTVVALRARFPIPGHNIRCARTFWRNP